jgi:hypothetical protein
VATAFIAGSNTNSSLETLVYDRTKAPIGAKLGTPCCHAQVRTNSHLFFPKELAQQRHRVVAGCPNVFWEIFTDYSLGSEALWPPLASLDFRILGSTSAEQVERTQTASSFFTSTSIQKA